MARLEIVGIDKVMGDLNQQGGRLRPIIEEALRRSADVLREQLIAEEMDSFKAPTGELGRNIEISPVGHAAGASIIDVYADGIYTGTRGSPRSAGMIGALVENKHKNPWQKRARKKSAKRINAIIADALKGE